MTQGMKDADFESLVRKVAFTETSQDDFDVSSESSNISQEDMVFIMSFDKLHELQKAARKKLRCDFLGIVAEIDDAIARNGKQYLKLQLKDIHGKTQILCLFEETAYYCSAEKFSERYLSNEEHSLLFIQSLQWDGKYLSVDKWSLIDHGINHPQASAYKQAEDYLSLKILPKGNDHLATAISKSCFQVEKLVQRVLTFIEQQEGIIAFQSEPFLTAFTGKIAEIAFRKTYSGMSYLLQGEEQLTITTKYANYFVGQLKAILDIVANYGKEPTPLSYIVLFCVLERWQRELVSLHEFEQVQHKGSV